MIYSIEELDEDNDAVIIQLYNIIKSLEPAELYFLPPYVTENNIKELIKGNRDCFFYSINIENNLISWFIHFELPLKDGKSEKLIIKQEWWKEKTEMILLCYALNRVISNKKYEEIQVEVFEKNSLRLNGYLKLGMRIINYRNWYDLTSHCKATSATTILNYSNILSRAFRLINNELFYDGLHIGVLVNTDHLFVYSDLEAVVKNLPYLFKSKSLNAIYLISKKSHDFLLLDKSFTLKTSISSLLSAC